MLRAGGLGTTLPFTTGAKPTQHQMIKKQARVIPHLLLALGNELFFT